MLCTAASIVVLLNVLLDKTLLPRPREIRLADGVLFMQAACQHFRPAQIDAQTQAGSIVTAAERKNGYDRREEKSRNARLHPGRKLRP